MFPETINFLEYDPTQRRLTVAFDSLRKTVFYRVDPEVAALMVDSASLDDAFRKHIFGRYEWTEIGALATVPHAATV
ncbi:MAG: KTSC domain-containing protein [Dokdonella sp.]